MKFNKILSAAVAAGLMFGTASMSVSASVGEAKSNQFWWPEQLNLAPLRQHSPDSNPYGADFNYAKAFAKLDLATVKKDIETTLD